MRKRSGSELLAVPVRLNQSTLSLDVGAAGWFRLDETTPTLTTEVAVRLVEGESLLVGQQTADSLRMAKPLIDFLFAYAEASDHLRDVERRVLIHSKYEGEEENA